MTLGLGAGPGDYVGAPEDAPERPQVPSPPRHGHESPGTIDPEDHRSPLAGLVGVGRGYVQRLWLNLVLHD